MLLFKLLLLAHFVADFPLQTDAVHRMKLRSVRGQLLHAGICLAAAAAAGWPLLRMPSYWAFIAALAACHMAADILKVRVLDRLAGPGNLWTFLLDQGLHVGAAAAVFATGLAAPALLDGGALGRLDGAGWIDAAVLFSAAVFGGGYLLDAARRTLRSTPEEALPGGRLERWYGIAERAAVFALVAAGGFWWLFVPAVVLIRLPAANRRAKRFEPRGTLLSRADAAGNVVIAAAAALCALLARRV
ncbi:MAG: DUF3307 domain-containing protein [bacterium]|nr:DUF3307 domain-containing protein [bacterium]